MRNKKTRYDLQSVLSTAGKQGYYYYYYYYYYHCYYFLCVFCTVINISFICTCGIVAICTPTEQWRLKEKIFGDGGLAPHHLGGDNG